MALKFAGGGTLSSHGELLGKFNLPEDKLLVVMNSRIDPVKNHMLMVDAIHELPENIRNRILVVCTGERSSSYYDAVVQRIAEYQLQEQFQFVGWVNPYEIMEIADIMMMPSIKEGFLLSAIEAFLAKVPVARTVTGGWEDMKDYCLELSADDTAPIKRIITQMVMEGPSAFAEMTDRAYSWAIDNCTVERMTRNTVAVYNKALEICNEYSICKRCPK